MPSNSSHQFLAGRLSGRADPSDGTDPHPVRLNPAGELGEGMGKEDRTVVRTYGDGVPMPVGDEHERKNLAHNVEGQSRCPPLFGEEVRTVASDLYNIPKAVSIARVCAVIDPPKKICLGPGIRASSFLKGRFDRLSHGWRTTSHVVPGT